MEFKEAEEFLRGKLLDYLETTKRTGEHIRKDALIHCRRPDHQDENPSAQINEKTVHCYGCGKTYSIFDIIGWDYGITSFSGQVKKAAEMYGITINKGGKTMNRKQPATVPADLTAYFAQCHGRISETDYPARRGLSAQIVEKFNIGFDPKWRHPKFKYGDYMPYIIIPTGKNTYFARATTDDVPEKLRKMKVGSVNMIGLDAVGGIDPFFIVEGEIDALSFWEIGIPAVGLGSANNIGKFIDYMKEHRPKAAVIWALDNDGAGNEATEKAKAELDSLKIFSFTADTAALYSGRKDANDALVVDRNTFKEAAEGVQAEAESARAEWQEREEESYTRTSLAGYFDTFLESIKPENRQPATATGFDTLDEDLGGGLYPGLYIVGAVPSLGKTTFTLQIADYIAQNNQDVLFFSLEMSKREIIAKSLSRMTYKLGGGDVARTTRQILNDKYEQGKEAENLDNAIFMYRTFIDHVYVYEGVGDIGVKQIAETTASHISVTGRRPVVFVDYLQIIAPADIRATDKANTDKAVLELKRMSRDLNIPVVVVSSFNRLNYKNQVEMNAFKESGAIEYSSDVLIGLQFKGQGKEGFDTNAARQGDKNEKGNPRDVEAVILKNRNGKAGDSINFKFYAMFNYFEDMDVPIH